MTFSYAIARRKSIRYGNGHIEKLDMASHGIENLNRSIVEHKPYLL